MSRVWMVLAVALAATPARPQSLLQKGSSPQYVAAVTSTSVATVAPGGTVTLATDVTPRPKIHVYANDWDGMLPVAVVVTSRADVQTGRAKMPIAETLPGGTSEKPLLVYTKPFRVEQPITIAKTAKSGEQIVVTGVLKYQACDDALCYPAASLPLTWTIAVK